jgi:hypothetical protein
MNQSQGNKNKSNKQLATKQTNTHAQTSKLIWAGTWTTSDACDAPSYGADDVSG